MIVSSGISRSRSRRAEGGQIKIHRTSSSSSLPAWSSAVPLADVIVVQTRDIRSFIVGVAVPGVAIAEVDQVVVVDLVQAV